MKIAILGAGSFGTALGVLLSKKNFEINIWDKNDDILEGINKNHRNPRYLKDIEIPDNVSGCSNIENTLKDAEYIVLAVPSQAIRNVSATIKPYLQKKQIIVNLAKGIEENSFSRLSEVIKQETGHSNIVVLSGPSHAEEVVNNIPTTVTVASENMTIAYKVQDTFMTDSFRIYTNDDVTGVEVGGAAKNVIALAAGVLDGMGLGDNTRAALMVRGINEITAIGMVLGGRAKTFNGLSGIGDLIVTCTSMHSRNRRAGMLIGQGKSLEETLDTIGMVVEGVKACECFYKLKEDLNIEMPITDTLYNVLFKGKCPLEATKELMTRQRKDEFGI